MSYRKSMILLLMVALLGCSTLGKKVTSENNEVRMPHYIFWIPPNAGWYVRTEDDPFETTIVSMDLGIALAQMKFLTQTILDERLRMMTAKEVADDYREKEKIMMIEQGVKKGLYELPRGPTMSEEILGGRTFYIMYYQASSTNNFQDAWLYLLFPKESHNDWFIVAHYSLTAPHGLFIANNRKPDFLATLQSLDTR